MTTVVIVGLVLSIVAGVYVLFGRVWIQERAVKKAIVAYDLALTDAFLNSDAGELVDVATADQRSSVASYLGLFELQGTRLEAELISLEMIEVEITDSGAVAEVQELWRYDRLDTDGLPTGDRTVEASTLRYVLIETSGGLMVDDVTVIRTESREDVAQ